MIDGFDERELLEYVEGTLDSDRVRELETRLEPAPAVRAELAAMRADRTHLRGLDAPAPPIDFVRELEPRLARSMLVSTVDAPARPGAYRRRHRRAARRWRTVVFAAAAVLVVAAFAAVWSVASLAPRRPADPGVAAAPASPPLPPAPVVPADSEETDDASAWPPPDAVVHHAGPLPARTAAAPAPPAASGPGGDPTPVTLPFLLVLPAGVAEAETLLIDVTSRLAGDEAATGTALVRNFTWDEAHGLLARLHARGLTEDRPPDRLSGVGGPDGAPAIEASGWRRRRVAGMLRGLSGRELGDDDDRRLSRRLLGAETLAPSYEQQLELSSTGASYTVTVPVRRLPELLRRLRVDGGLETELRSRPAPPVSAGSALPRWLDDYRAARVFVERLLAEHPDAHVMVPVALETPGRD